jgi:UDP-N-acetylmuramate-alanine ligase
LSKILGGKNMKEIIFDKGVTNRMDPTVEFYGSIKVDADTALYEITKFVNGVGRTVFFAETALKNVDPRLVAEHIAKNTADLIRVLDRLEFADPSVNLESAIKIL